MGVISFRTYFMIAITVTALNLAVVYFDTGRAFAGFFSEVGRNAARYGLGQGLTNVIVFPLEQAYSDYYWAVGAGLLWPVLAIVFLLFIIVFVFSVLGPTFRELSTIG